MALVYPEITFSYIISIIGLIYGIALLIFLKELRTRPETVMARFKLNKDKTTHDFKKMLAGNISLILAMGMLFISIATSNSVLMNVSYIFQIFSAGIIVYTILTWVRDYAIK